MHLLSNGVQSYAWGSTDEIPRFLGEEPRSEPVAEVWIGTHPIKPSRVGDRLLSDLVGDLPFLVKILAAQRPLSLQVHPSRRQAEAGFAREEELGIPREAPNRVFRDANHKPEMVLALSTFDSLIGFRPTAEILRVLGPLDTSLGRQLADDLRRDPGWAGIVRRIERLLTDPPSAHEVDELVVACATLAEQGIDVKRAYQTVVEVAQHYPGDVGVVISLMLNRMTLQPGEAAYLETGVIHAHLRGMCLEVMATSDNVLRAGLTNKHVDAQGLVECLSTGMARIARVTPDYAGSADTELFSPVGAEFALAAIQVSYADPAGVPLQVVPESIVVCLGGEVQLLSSQGEKATLKRGESVYLGAEDGGCTVLGLGEVAQVFAPATRALRSRMIDVV